VSKKHAPKKPAPYHRETGVFPGGGPRSYNAPPVLDGGHDAPLAGRSRVAFRYALLAIFVLFGVLMLLSIRGY
jgi:hypothetical protein